MPDAQFTHTEASEDEYVPGSQLVHDEAPVESANLPPAQGMHDPIPLLPANFPISQSAQEAALDAE